VFCKCPNLVIINIIIIIVNYYVCVEDVRVTCKDVFQADLQASALCDDRLWKGLMGMAQSFAWVGLTRGLGWVGLGWVGSVCLWVGLGRGL